MSEFSRILTEYLERVDAGEDVSLQDFLAKHPEHADRIGQFLSNHGVVSDGIGHSVSPPALQPDLDGRQLGNFQLGVELGRGGMGIVYEAQDLTTSRAVALKILPQAGGVAESELARFQNEVQATASLSHDHIVPVYSVGEEGGTHYFAMKLIDGMSLGQLIRAAGAGLPYSEWPSTSGIRYDTASSTTEVATKESNRTTSSSSRSPKYEDICRMIADVAGALDYAHAKGVVHRDIKPSNLLIGRSGKVWITDFGLARLENQDTITATGDLLGTVQYMSPEQAMGNREIDGRSDIYSLGVILYQLLTGELPFRGNHRVVLHRLLHEDPVDPRSLNPTVPRDLATICMKCLQKKPAQRYATAQNLADDMQDFLAGRPIKARPTPWVERTWKWCCRNRGATTAIATVVASVIVIICVSQLSLKASRANEAKARKAEEQARSSELHALQLLYATEMEQASKAYKSGNVKETRIHLNQAAEVDPGRHLRGLEWDYLWQRTSQDARVFCTSSSEIYTVVPSPDGEQLLVAGADSNLQFFDATTGCLRHSIQTEQDEINDIVFSRTGKLIATAGDDGTVKIWNAMTRELVSTAKSGEQIVWTAAFLSDDRIIATCDNESLRPDEKRGSLRQFDVFRVDGELGEILATGGCDCGQRHGQKVCRGASQLVVLPDRDVVGGRDAIHRWSETDGNWRLCDGSEPLLLYDIEVDPSRNLLFLCSKNELVVRDLETSKPLLRIPQVNGVLGIALFPKRGYLAISVRGGQVIVYRMLEVDGKLQQLERVDAWAVEGNEPHTLVASADEQRLLYSLDNQLYETPLIEKAKQSHVVDGIYIGDRYSRSFLVMGNDGQIAKSDIACGVQATGMADYTLTAEAGIVAGISRDPKNREIQVWRIDDGEVLYSGKSLAPDLDRIQVSRDGNYLALFNRGSVNGRMLGMSAVLDWKAGKYTIADKGGMSRWNVSFDHENRIVFAPRDQLVCRDAESGEVLWHDDDTRVTQYTVHPSENLLAVGTTAHRIELRDSGTGEIVRQIPTESRVRAIAFTSDGDRLGYTRSDADDFFLVDVLTGRTVLSVPSAFQNVRGFFPGTFIENDTVFTARFGYEPQTTLLNLGQRNGDGACPPAP